MKEADRLASSSMTGNELLSTGRQTTTEYGASPLLSYANVLCRYWLKQGTDNANYAQYTVDLRAFVVIT